MIMSTTESTELSTMNCRSTFKTLILCQLSELTTVAFRANKILSTVGVEIPEDRSVQSYKNPFKFKS